MKGVLAIMGRELRSYFLSPLGWVVATGFLFVNGLVFQTIVDFLNDPRSPGTITPFDFFFGGTLFYWLAVLFVAPVITMRLISEERKSGTIELLLTAPVTEGQVVTGKFLGALLFYTVIWLPTVVYGLLLDRHMDLDWGPVAASYVGTIGVGALLLSMGLFASALAKNQVVAAVTGFSLMFLAFLPAFLEALVNDPGLQALMQYLNLFQHMADFAIGVVDSRRLVYYASTTVFFLFLSSRALQANKGR